MSLVGQCHICGAPAMMACPLCGLVTCKKCINPDSRVCRACTRKMREQSQEEDE